MEGSNIDYDQKFKEMQSYLPFLEGIINRIENTANIKNESIKGIHLPKIKSLKSLLSENNKRMKMENLIRCEQVLKKIKDKFEKNTLEMDTVETKSITPSHEELNINDNNIASCSNILDNNSTIDLKTKNSVNNEKPTAENVELPVKPNFNFYQELPSCKTLDNDSPENIQVSDTNSSNNDLQTCREKLKEITKLTDTSDVEKTKPFEKEIQLVTEAYISSKTDSKSFSEIISESISNISKNIELSGKLPEINSTDSKKPIESLKNEALKRSISENIKGKLKLSICSDRIAVKNMMEKCVSIKFVKKDSGSSRESRKDWKKDKSYSQSRQFKKDSYDNGYSKSRSKSKDSSQSSKSKDHSYKKNHTKRKKSHETKIHSSSKDFSDPKINDKLLDITSPEKLEEKTDINKLKKLRKQLKKELKKEIGQSQNADVTVKTSIEGCELNNDENDQISLLYNNIIENLNESDTIIEEKSPKTINSPTKLFKDQALHEVDKKILDSNNEKPDRKKTFPLSLNRNTLKLNLSIDKSKTVVENAKTIPTNSETKSQSIVHKDVANVLKDLGKKPITDNFTKKYLEDAIKLGELCSVKQPSLDVDNFETNDKKVEETKIVKDEIHYFCDKDHNLHPQIEQEVLNALKDDLETLPDIFENKLSKKEDPTVKPKIKEHPKDGNVNEQNKLEPKSRRISLEEYKEKMQKESNRKVDMKYKGPIEILNRVLTPKEIERFDSVIQTTVEESLNDSEVINAETAPLVVENDGSESSEFLGPESPDSNSSFIYDVDRSPENIRRISEIQELQEPDTNDQHFFNKGNVRPWHKNEIPNQNNFNISPQRVNNEPKIIPNKEVQNPKNLLDKNGSNVSRSKCYNTPEFESKKSKKKSKSKNQNANNLVEDRRAYFPNLTNRFNVNFPVSANYRGKNPKPLLGTSSLPVPVKNSNPLNINPELIPGNNPYNNPILDISKNIIEQATIPYLISQIVTTFCSQNADRLPSTPSTHNRKTLLETPIDRNPGTLNKKDSLATTKLPLLPEPDCSLFHSTPSDKCASTSNNSKYPKPTTKTSVSALDPRLKKYDVNKKDETFEKSNVHGSVQNIPNISQITSSIINVSHNDPRIKHMKEKSDLNITKERNSVVKDKNQVVKAADDSNMKNDESLDSQKCPSFKIPKVKKDDGPIIVDEEPTSKSKKCTSKDDMNAKPKKMKRDVVIIDETETFVIYDEMITYDLPTNKNDTKNDDSDCVIVDENTKNSEFISEVIVVKYDDSEVEILKDPKLDDNVITIDDLSESLTVDTNEKQNDCKNEKISCEEKASVKYEDKDEKSVKDSEVCVKDDQCQTIDSQNINDEVSLKPSETEVKNIEHDNLIEDTESSEKNDVAPNEAECDKVSEEKEMDKDVIDTNIKDVENCNPKNDDKNIESSKENAEKKGGNDELYHSLTDILQDKQKMLEMISRASQAPISHKLMKKLVLLSQLDSDDEAEENKEDIPDSNKENKADDLPMPKTDEIVKESTNNSSNQENSNDVSVDPEKISSNEDAKDNSDNSSTKTKSKPKVKFRSEVALLREALPEVFINAGGLQPAGIRTCRLVKELNMDPIENHEPKRSTRQKATVEKPPKPSSPSLKASKRTKSPMSDSNMIKQPIILLEKTTVDTSLEESISSASFETQSSESSFAIDESLESKTSEDLDTSFESTKPCPKSKKKHYSVQETGEAEISNSAANESDLQEIADKSTNNDEIPVISDNNKDSILKPSAKKGIKKRKKQRWSTGYLKKKNPHKTPKAKLTNAEIAESSVENTDADSVFSEKNENCSESIEYNSDKNDTTNLCDLSYHFVNKTIRYKCMLCNYNSDRYIVKHYKLKHSKYEVLISRLSPKEAKVAIDEASGVKVITDSNVISRYDYRCRFCQKYSYSYESFYKHIIQNHTGEYDLKTKKGLIDLGNWNKYDKAVLNGHICSICNFTQISKDNMEKHVAKFHANEKCEILSINLSSIPISEDKIEKNNDDEDSEVNVEVYLEDDDKNESQKEQNASPPHTEAKEGDGVFSLSGNATMLSDEYESLNMTEFKIKEELIENEKDYLVENTDLSVIVDVKPEPDIPPVKNFFERFVESTEIPAEKERPFERKSISIGELTAKLISKTKTELICKINKCVFACSNYLEFVNHINSKHVYEMWNGFCKICNKTYEFSGYDLALNHLMTHITPNTIDLFAQSVESISKTSSDNTPKINVRPMHHLLPETFPPSESMLPRIENVMSLNPEAIQSNDNAYNLTEMINHNQKIVPIAPKRDTQKEDAFYYHGIRMNYSKSELFRCAACPMSFNTSDIFLKHCKLHSQHEDTAWLCCVYCKLEFESQYILVEHVIKRHSNSRFECKFCNFRTTSYIVTFQHTLVAHSENPSLFDRVRYSRSNINYTPSHNLNLLPKEACVPTYICTYENNQGICGEKFYSSEMYLAHMSNPEHNVPMPCQYCRKEKMQPLNILLHLRQFHHYNLYRCAYCYFGTDIPIAIVDHLSILHYAEKPIYYYCKSFLDKPEENSSEMSLSMVEKVDLNENVKHHLENIFDLGIKFDGSIVKYPKRKCDRLSLLKLSPPKSTAKKSEYRRSIDPSKNSPSFNFLEREIINDTNLLNKVGEISKHFNKDSPKTDENAENRLLKETTVANLVLNKDRGKRFSDSNWQFDPEETNVETLESSGSEPPLTGKALFRCGSDGCDMSFEVPGTAMLQHLEFCKQRNSDYFKCYHCKKPFNKPSSLVSHMSFHGELRYECGICSKFFRMRVQCVSHMKYSHSTEKMEAIPVVPNKANHHTDHFVVRALETDSSAPTCKKKHDKQKSKESNPVIEPVKIDRFRPEDINNLPHERILNEMIYCANCSYSTKVTSNMLRHLKQHTSELFVPTLAPVNPVPHLHTNEMHFDKMTNLALSSNIDRNPVRRNSATPIIVYPQHVPLRERFVCGSENCRYTSVSEKMLQIHWRTLHKDENLFHCLHCLENIELDTDPKTFSGRIWSHLRLHGEALFKCDKCKFQHHSIVKMKHHKADAHKNMSLIEILRFPNTKEVKWACKICDAIKLEKKAMTSHCISKHGGIYRCGACSIIVTTKGHIDFHFKEQHRGISKTFTNIYEKHNVLSKILSDPDFSSKRRLSLNSEDDDRTVSVAKKAKTSQNEESPKNQPSIKPDKLNMPFGESRNDGYLCPFCVNFTTKESSSFQVHLYEELNYRTWCCGLCGYKSFDEKKINLHSLDEHRSVAVHTRSNYNMNIEEWVRNCIIHQKKDIAKASNKPQSNSKNDVVPEDDFDDDDDKLVIYLEEDEKSEIEEKQEEKEEKKVEKKAEKEKGPPKKSLDKKSVKISKDKTVVKCKHCTYLTNNRSNLNNHEMKHWSVQPFRCSICPQQFVSKKEIVNHHKSKHPTHPLKIMHNILPSVPEIGPIKRYRRNPGTDLPTRTSQRISDAFNEKSEAEKASTDTSADSKLKKLLTSDAKEPQLAENDLNAKPDVAFSLMMQKDGLFYKCAICCNKFCTNKELLHHFKEVHDTQDMLEESLDTFLCIYCENKFEDFALLTDHHVMCHPNMAIGIYPLNFAQIHDTGEIKSNFVNEKGSYDCIISACEMNFDNLHMFKTHVRNHYYIYKCDLCMQSFQFSAQYFDHCKKVHNKNLPKSSDNKQLEVLDRISQIDRLIFHLVDLYKNQAKNTEASGSSTSTKVKQTARKSTASLVCHKKVQSDHQDNVFNAKKRKLSDLASENVVVKQEDDDNDVLIIDC